MQAARGALLSSNPALTRLLLPHSQGSGCNACRQQDCSSGGGGSSSSSTGVSYHPVAVLLAAFQLMVLVERREVEVYWTWETGGYYSGGLLLGQERVLRRCNTRFNTSQVTL